ncbi:hypothetical protein KL905_004904 [Ogataea polymorpha]|nr:hypothetical protein KL937_004703 [Ogataea polymorpha]KAG7889161.1 hypothetical protein KL908_004961 [Ogataea polymorpha]KAG7897848.1 hypothetical protein KL935_004723 [Ogataea polymorpha]KAG7900080.1 hypothetical protein KL907_004842 [Ogataea polymorpha]KAG7906083.1 hypothetical protein KL906_004862 [Ogataea polymorpha]
MVITSHPLSSSFFNVAVPSVELFHAAPKNDWIPQSASLESIRCALTTYLYLEDVCVSLASTFSTYSETSPLKSVSSWVEPKVFFANERTFLSWLNFTVVLGSLAIGLLNFGDKVGRISASLFTLIAMGTMIYALVTYHWRAAAIRRRGSGPYDDRFGPTMLCFFLLIAVIVNFTLRIRA